MTMGPSRFTFSRGLAALAAGLALAGCATEPAPPAFDVVVARFFLEAPPQRPQVETAVLPVSGIRVPVLPEAVLSEADYTNVDLVRVDFGLCLVFQFGPEAARHLHRITASNLGRRIVVTLNGKPFGARLVDGPIADGRFFVFLELPDEDLAREAVNLKRTALEIVQPAIARRRAK
jgi:hypothetical protein